tara:strand:- start:478 stop:690 length:213 start_codon:yes stop_codon:yes gene_type:complete
MEEMNEETPGVEEKATTRQKKVWEDCGVFETYAEAKIKSESLESESKIKRCGTDGVRFKVKRVTKILGAE